MPRVCVDNVPVIVDDSQETPIPFSGIEGMEGIKPYVDDQQYSKKCDKSYAIVKSGKSVVIDRPMGEQDFSYEGMHKRLFIGQSYI